MSNVQSAEAPANSVRRLSKPDLDRVVAIDQAIAGRSRQGFFENRVAASLADPAGFISLGYVEGDTLQGYVLAHMLDGEFGGRHPIAVLDAVGVDKAARGHGGAHALLAELQRAARGRGAHAIRTQIGWPDEGMAHFLALAGFRLGTRLVLGGERPPGPGAWYPVTLLADVVPGMPAYDEELFGPVAAILPAQDDEEALRIANDSAFGLGAAVFSRDVARGEAAALTLAAGTVAVNTHVRSDPRLPFGGIKASGLGRELGADGIRALTWARTVLVG